MDGAPKQEFHKWTRTFPGLRTDPIPIEPYISPNFFEAERSSIFRRCWLNVGRVTEIPEARDFFVRSLAIGETSLLVVRGDDGVIRGFHNVCQHRGNHVSWRARGRCKGAFVCKFHGWVYDTYGRCVHVPDEGNYFDLNKKNHGLKEVATDTWRGFIFVNLDDEPQQSLLEYLGDAGKALERYPFEKMPVCYTYQAEEKVNWKVLLDAQQEGAHVPFLHRLSLGPSIPKEPDFVARMHSFQAYGPHRRLSSSANPSFNPTPTMALAAKYGPGALEAFAGKSQMSGTEGDAMVGIFDFYVIFPNFVIALLYGTYFTYNIWPLEVDRTLWEIRMYYPKPKNVGELFANEYGHIGLRDGLLEDASTHERVQAGLKSGAIKYLLFQDEEVLLRHAHAVVGDYVSGKKTW